jgi:hypothetical protein
MRPPDDERSLPNLVIIGAPKCGTTSLHFYLDQHPEISMSSRKELRYFTRPDWRVEEAWYRQQFAAFDTPIRGEATPRYARYPHIPGVPERMHALIPDAKLIYLVRDPFARIASHWAQVWSDGDHTPLEARLREPDGPMSSLVAPSLYHTQLRRYLAYYRMEQILVVDHDELRLHRAATLRGIFSFIGVDEAYSSASFAVERNVSGDKRGLPGWRQRAWDRLVAPGTGVLPRSARRAARDRAFRVLSQPAPTAPEIDRARHSKLAARLADEANSLRALTGLRLESWSV